MSINRTSHAVYETSYHSVWAPEYRQWILRGSSRVCPAEVLADSRRQWLWDRSHGNRGGPGAHILRIPTQRFDGRSCTEVQGKIGWWNLSGIAGVKSELWGGEFWADSYSVRTIGDKVTKQAIKKYIEYHQQEETRVHQQLKLL